MLARARKYVFGDEPYDQWQGHTLAFTVEECIPESKEWNFALSTSKEKKYNLWEDHWNTSKESLDWEAVSEELQKFCQNAFGTISPIPGKSTGDPFPKEIEEVLSALGQFDPVISAGTKRNNRLARLCLPCDLDGFFSEFMKRAGYLNLPFLKSASNALPLMIGIMSSHLQRGVFALPTEKGIVEKLTMLYLRAITSLVGMVEEPLQIGKYIPVPMLVRICYRS